MGLIRQMAWMLVLVVGFLILLNSGALFGMGAAAASQLVFGPTPMTTSTSIVDRECWLNYWEQNNTPSLGAAVPAPSNQPWVRTSWDCRYSVKSENGVKLGDLNPKGCYGLDPGGSYLIYRQDFCPKPSPSH